MTAPAPAGQEFASSEDENTLCFLCFRKKLGPSWQHKASWCLKTSMPHIHPHIIGLERGGEKKSSGFHWEKETSKELSH